MPSPLGPQAGRGIRLTDVGPGQRMPAGVRRRPDGAAVVVARLPHPGYRIGVEVAVGVAEPADRLPGDLLQDAAAAADLPGQRVPGGGQPDMAQPVRADLDAGLGQGPDFGRRPAMTNMVAPNPYRRRTGSACRAKSA